jgi:hypothetical protein
LARPLVVALDTACGATGVRRDSPDVRLILQDGDEEG